MKPMEKIHISQAQWVLPLCKACRELTHVILKRSVPPNILRFTAVPNHQDMYSTFLRLKQISGKLIYLHSKCLRRMEKYIPSCVRITGCMENHVAAIHFY